MNEKGFSLSEVLVTVAIISILSSIAFINYGKYRHSTHAKVVEEAIKDIEKNFIACYRDREFSSHKWDHDNNSNTPPVSIKTSDCFTLDIQGAIEGKADNNQGVNRIIQGKINIVFNHSSDKSKGCWRVKVIRDEGFVPDKEMIQCIDFSSTGGGNKINHFKDCACPDCEDLDGNGSCDSSDEKTGVCQAGVCK